MKRLSIIFCSMLITIYSIPVFTGYFVFADTDPDLIPYEDQLQDSTASIYVYLKDKGFTFSNTANDTIDNLTSFMMIHSMQTYSSATGTDFAQNMQILKNGTGLIDGENGKYYYSPQAQDLLNKFVNWFVEENELSDGMPDTGVTYGEYGSLRGDDGVKYAVFNYRSASDFDWGSFAPIGSVYSDLIGQKGTFTISTPWGSQSVSSTIDSKNQSIVMTGFGSASFRSLYSTTSYGSVIVLKASPVLVIKNGNSNTVYKGSIRYDATHNQYLCQVGSYTYKTFNNGDPLPLPELPFEYNGDPLPDDSVEPTEPSVVNINYNDYGDIIDNTQNITIINDDPDEPDDTIPYDPYPNNPNYDPSDPYSPPSNTPLTPSDPNGNDNVDLDLDLDLNLPSINWSLGDLTDKFPFSIPFDLYNMFSVLNTEPQTPEIKGNVNLGIYQWQIDWNLHQFDDTAALLRNIEFVGFVIGLIFVTRNIIKG